MQLNITGHHVEITPSLREFATSKLERLSQHFSRMKIISIDVTFEIEKLEQIAKATVHAAGVKFHAESTKPDLYTAIDALIDKLEQQLKKHKDKLLGHQE